MQDFSVNFDFTFTDTAFAELRGRTPTLPSAPGGVPTPQVGDFVSIPGCLPFSFKVIGREIEYTDLSSMKVTVVLDIVGKESAMPHLTRIK